MLLACSCSCPCTLFHYYAPLTAQLSVPKRIPHTSLLPCHPIQSHRYFYCQRSVRPNALHITFWSFYDLSISLIVRAIPLAGGQDVWMSSGVARAHPATLKCAWRSVWLTRFNRISAEEHLRVKLSTGSHRFTLRATKCCDCCVLCVYSSNRTMNTSIKVLTRQLFAKLSHCLYMELDSIAVPRGTSSQPRLRALVRLKLLSQVSNWVIQIQGFQGSLQILERGISTLHGKKYLNWDEREFS